MNATMDANQYVEIRGRRWRVCVYEISEESGGGFAGFFEGAGRSNPEHTRFLPRSDDRQALYALALSRIAEVQS